jgi:hypothetical protein
LKGVAHPEYLEKLLKAAHPEDVTEIVPTVTETKTTTTTTKSVPKTTPKPEFNCSEVKLGQFLAIGEPRRIVMTGFPKSGAMWFKSVVDNILPYYFWLEERVTFLKFVFSKKAIRIDKIFTVNLTITTGQ